MSGTWKLLGLVSQTVLLCPKGHFVAGFVLLVWSKHDAVFEAPCFSHLIFYAVSASAPIFYDIVCYKSFLNSRGKLCQCIHLYYYFFINQENQKQELNIKDRLKFQTCLMKTELRISMWVGQNLSELWSWPYDWHVDRCLSCFYFLLMSDFCNVKQRRTRHFAHPLDENRGSWENPWGPGELRWTSENRLVIFDVWSCENKECGRSFYPTNSQR